MKELKENEKWVVGYEGFYSVTTEGEVYSHHFGRYKKIQGGILKVHKTGKRTYRVALLQVNGISKSCYFHRMVAEAFIPNHDNKPQVNHIDGNKLNNRLENLEWVTHKENSSHAWETGLNNNSYLVLQNEEIVRRSNELLYGKLEHDMLKYYCETADWAYIQSKGIPPELKSCTIPKGFINLSSYWLHMVNLFKDMEDGKTIGQLAMKHGVDPSGLSKIRNKYLKKPEWSAYDRIKEKYDQKMEIIKLYAD